VAAGAAIASAGVKIYGDVQAGRYQTKVAENNAKLAEGQAASEAVRGAQEASAIEAQGRAAGAQALAATAASGIETTVGSGAAIQAASTVNAMQDAEVARSNAARRAWGYLNEAQDLRAEKGMIRRGSVLTGIGTGLSGVGQAVGSFAGVK